MSPRLNPVGHRLDRKKVGTGSSVVFGNRKLSLDESDRFLTNHFSFRNYDCSEIHGNQPHTFISNIISIKKNVGNQAVTR